MNKKLVSAALGLPLLAAGGRALRGFQRPGCQPACPGRVVIRRLLHAVLRERQNDRLLPGGRRKGQNRCHQ